MMKQRILVILTTILLLSPRLGLAHEFWIEAREHQVSPGGKIEAGLFNGQNFQGVEMAWFPPRIVRSGWNNGAASGDFDSGPGDRPAIHVKSNSTGLFRLIYEAAPQQLTYTDWEKFSSFAQEKGHAWAIDRHAARDLPRTGFKESYRRFCKALVAVGEGVGNDDFSGMEFELIAVANPYVTPPNVGIPVELRYDGNPLPDTTITIFAKSPVGVVSTSHLTTDGSGQVVVPVASGHRYLIDAVVLREPTSRDPDNPHAWESLWASLTFAIPQ